AMVRDEIYSKVMRAGTRTYFFDVRPTKAGDCYLTITESKKFTNDDGSSHYKKHKIYLHKEEFNELQENPDDMIDYLIAENGKERISERHQKDYKKETDELPKAAEDEPENIQTDSSNFTDIEFDDI